jgi:microcystin-dependent protein
MPLPFDNMQASLALTQFIPLSGIFPANNSDPNVDPGGIPLGSIRTFAGNFAPGGSAQAGGQLLPINQNQALFALLGTMYGGNGTTNFALPDLDGQTMIGGQLGFGSRPAIGSNDTRLVNAELPSSLGGSSQPLDNYQASLPVTYLIRTAGVFPSFSGSGNVNFIGQIVPFAGGFVPDGFLQANGQELQIADFPALFQPHRHDLWRRRRHDVRAAGSDRTYRRRRPVPIPRNIPWATDVAVELPTSSGGRRQRAAHRQS